MSFITVAVERQQPLLLEEALITKSALYSTSLGSAETKSILNSLTSDKESIQNTQVASEDYKVYAFYCP